MTVTVSDLDPTGSRTGKSCVGLKARGGVSFLLSIKRRAATVSTLKNGSDAFS
jgi:hypothetical protein